MMFRFYHKQIFVTNGGVSFGSSPEYPEGKVNLATIMLTNTALAEYYTTLYHTILSYTRYSFTNRVCVLYLK